MACHPPHHLLAQELLELLERSTRLVQDWHRQIAAEPELAEPALAEPALAEPEAAEPGPAEPGSVPTEPTSTSAEPALAAPPAEAPKTAAGAGTFHPRRWRRALSLPPAQAEADFHWALAWLAARPTTPRPSISVRPPPRFERRGRRLDPLLGRAAQPTFERLRPLAGEVSPTVGALLGEAAVHLFDRGVSIIGMRRQAGANDWHMKIFQREIGMPLRRLIRECRLSAGARLLRDTSLTVERIADLVGYESQRGLEKLLRETTRLSPAHLRECLRLVPAGERPLFDQLFSWWFFVSHHRGSLETEALLSARAFLEGRLASE